MNSITALVPLSAVVASATVLAQISGIQVKAGDRERKESDYQSVTRIVR
jgi:hypothetical protein